MTSYPLSRIAEALGLRLQGDDIVITGVNTLDEAGPTELSFLANPRYAPQLASTRAGAVIVRPEHAGEVKNALIGDDPYPAFARAIGMFAVRQGSFHGISPLASVSPEAELGADCTVYPFVYIAPRVRIGAGCTLFPGVYIGEGCIIGEGCTLYPNAVLMAGCVLGRGCVLQPGAVIGGEGFGFVRTEAGIQKIPQIGHVELGERVEIGVNSAVDRAALSATRIGDSTCLDNLVQVGHNVRLGRECLIVSQVGISGSTRVGDGVTMAGQVGVAGHLHIGDGVTIGPQAGVAKDIESGKVVGGTPTVDYSTYLRTLSLMPRFPDLFKRIAKLEKEMEELRGGE
ncbi:MAG: UDP-3-O-(3-hydroxymyristoyl)glucosamine N-acyltransferase [Desulfovibrionaceae bacterium]|nr:MAG: UDP-3-O-(3-hydroxymyristoyl)glucosamine N-acyltransferase [Desulfovibrionaceae bacterium]